MNIQISLCLPRDAQTVSLARKVAGATLGGLDVGPAGASELLVSEEGRVPQTTGGHRLLPVGLV